MSDTPQETTQPDTPPTGDQAPPHVDPVAPPTMDDETPDTNPETAAAVGEPDGKVVDASEDPNLGHALEDQTHGVGVGPTQTSAEGETAGDSGDVAGAI